MEVVEGSLVADVISQVKYYNPSKIICTIDSLGGDLFAALSIYNFLKDYPAKVECKIVGFCASAACVIAMAANPGKLTMPANGWFITHESSGNDISGTAAYIEQQAAVVKAQTANMAAIFAGRNTKGHTAEEILALWVNGDCWMTGEGEGGAVDYGFVDSCYNNTNALITASVTRAQAIYKNAPATITAAVEITETKTLNDHFMELKKFVTAAIDAIKGNKVKADSANISADIAEAIAQPLSDMADAMQLEVATERATITADLTTKITADLTASLTAHFAPIIEAQSKTITDLTADLTKIAGKQSAAGEPAKADGGKVTTLVGKFAE